MSKINGVIGIFTAPNGKVVCSANDFDTSGYGGFELHEAQKIRVKEKINMSVVKTYCGYPVYESISDHTARQIVGDMMNKGYSLVYSLVGHKGVDRETYSYLKEVE